LAQVLGEEAGELFDGEVHVLGILPPVLEQSGIGAAVEGVIERLRLPVRLQASSVRLSPAIEATAYFVVSEALANIVKHIQAHSAAVRIFQEDHVLIIQVDDDGRGGADAAGTGLAALADRVVTLGGQFAVASPPGDGTRLIARIPCG
jgi:signal transduction histidine kinase